MEEKRPLFLQQVREANPGKAVEFWVQDEARFGQQGTLTHQWAKRGSRPAQVRQNRYKSVYLYASVNPITGESSCIVATNVGIDLMGWHLDQLSKKLGPDRHAVLVLDQAGWHVSKKLVVPANITLLHLPPYSPELNPVERLWQWIKSHLLSNRTYQDKDALFDAGSKAFNSLSQERIRSICGTGWTGHEN